MDLHRENQIHSLKKEDKLWDLLVIGGGASGLGVALDGVSRGLSVLLVEKKDFGSGTSSRSTKLVHGGVRYLQQGNIRLVKEALKERSFMLKAAPHITRTQEFIIPFYSIWMGVYYFIGLKLYELLAGSQNIGKAKWLLSSTVIRKVPNIKRHRLKGGILYHDGQFDDARMCVDLVKTIVFKGGTCINYCEVQGFLKKDNLISGVVVKDTISNEEHLVYAKAVVNATGVFTNEILKMDGSLKNRMVVPSRGSHIVIDKNFIGGETAVMIPKTTDGRILFLIPWKDSAIVGTTDIKTEKPEYDPVIEMKEINFILDNTNRYLETSPDVTDIEALFSGLRPLAAPIDNLKKTKEISRGHKIFWTDSGLCNIIGGKWTTFRKMGEDVINQVSKKYNWKISRTNSASIQIISSEKYSNLSGGIPSTQELEHIIRTEMVETLEDLVARRTRILSLSFNKTISLLNEWAEILRVIKNKDQRWKDEEIKKVGALITRLKRPITHPS